MAEDQEGMQPQEYVVKNPEALKTGVRERMKGIADRIIEANPLTKAQSEAMEKVYSALPAGRLKDAGRFVLDVYKIPRAAMTASWETIKTIIPTVRVVAFVPEQIGAFFVRMGGGLVAKAAESGPARFAVGTVEGVMDKILGSRSGERLAPAEPSVPVNLENARQVLVGMAGPETGKQERRKMM